MILAAKVHRFVGNGETVECTRPASGMAPALCKRTPVRTSRQDASTFIFTRAASSAITSRLSTFTGLIRM